MEPDEPDPLTTPLRPRAAPAVLRSFSIRNTFRAFSYRNYRIFYFGQLISLIGSWMTTTAEGWLVYQLTGSKALLGIVVAAATAPMLILSTVGGWLADNYPKRSILVCTQLGSMCVALTLAFLVWQEWITTWHLITLALVSGVIMAFDMPARQAFVIELTSKRDLVNAISLNSAAFNGARIIGPSVAGVLMAKLGIAMCFFVDGISFIAVIAGLLMLRIVPVDAPRRTASVLSETLSGFRYVLQSPLLLRVFGLFAVVGIFGWSYSVLMPAIARDTLHLDEEGYGLLLGANGVGALCGALIIAATGHVFSPRRLAFSGLWLFCVMIIGFALTSTFWLACLYLAVSGLGLILFFSSANSAVQLSVRDEMRGRVMGIWALVFGGVVPLGSLQAGAMAQYFGATATLIIGAIICTFAAVVTLNYARRDPNQAPAYLGTGD
ncbi:MAG TPA: MFS transporter [Chthoniobacteraceae bacterium]|nr:MFS transporter [Chthoniobacteraceae bacterium]